MNANNITPIHHATGDRAISETVQKDYPYFLTEVRVTLSGVVSDLASLSVYLDSHLGSEYDHLLGAPDSSVDLSAVTSFRYADQVPPLIDPKDKLIVSWPNAGEVVWGLEILGG